MRFKRTRKCTGDDSETLESLEAFLRTNMRRTVGKLGIVLRLLLRYSIIDA